MLTVVFDRLSDTRNIRSEQLFDKIAKIHSICDILLTNLRSPEKVKVTAECQVVSLSCQTIVKLAVSPYANIIP